MKPKRKPMRKRMVKPGKCFYCEDKKNPHYLDVEILRKSLTDRGKIISRARSGVCAKHQRKLTIAIKRARHLALLPFIVRT